MHQPPNITPNREADDDSEYGFHEETQEKGVLLLMGQFQLQQLQLLLAALSTLRGGAGVEQQALERAGDYDLHDPLNDGSTRYLFRSTI